MIINKPYIDRIIKLRKENDDPVLEFAVRNKDSPINTWDDLQPYNKKELNLLYFNNIDGVKLKFSNTTLIINGRHKLE